MSFWNFSSALDSLFFTLVVCQVPTWNFSLGKGAYEKSPSCYFVTRGTAEDVVSRQWKKKAHTPGTSTEKESRRCKWAHNRADGPIPDMVYWYSWSIVLTTIGELTFPTRTVLLLHLRASKECKRHRCHFMGVVLTCIWRQI